MISTMAARRSVYGPDVKSTTRPTSTCLHGEVLTSISAISDILIFEVSFRDPKRGERALTVLLMEIWLDVESSCRIRDASLVCGR
jgi:hypothetical protein